MNYGLFQTCKTVYDRIIDLRIATPQIIMNYGLFLEENNYFEEAFKVRSCTICIIRKCCIILFVCYAVCGVRRKLEQFMRLQMNIRKLPYSKHKAYY